MKLMTKSIEKKLAKYPLYSTDGIKEKDVIVKYFNPMGLGTWYVFEGEKKENGDWLFFGLVDLYERELGYFTLSQLQEVQLHLGIGIKRDKYFTNQKMTV